MQFARNEATNKAELLPIVFANIYLASTDIWYCNIEREALGILPVLEMFNHYCFSHEVSMTTDNKQLVAIFKKDVVILSQKIQRMLLYIHQHSRRILYKATPQLFIADWLSRHNHMTKKYCA